MGCEVVHLGRTIAAVLRIQANKVPDAVFAVSYFAISLPLTQWALSIVQTGQKTSTCTRTYCHTLSPMDLLVVSQRGPGCTMRCSKPDPDSKARRPGYSQTKNTSLFLPVEWYLAPQYVVRLIAARFHLFGGNQHQKRPGIETWPNREKAWYTTGSADQDQLYATVDVHFRRGSLRNGEGHLWSTQITSMTFIFP